jgi:hypothetical protein
MLVTVKNIGKGKAMHTEAVLRQRHRPGRRPDQRRALRGQGARASETKTFSFVYEVRPSSRATNTALDLAVADTTLGESLTDKIKVKVAAAGPAPRRSTGTATVTRDDAPLREAAGEAVA